MNAPSPPGAIKSHPVATAEHSGSRPADFGENTPPINRNTAYTHTVSESTTSAYHTYNDPVNLNLRQSRSSRLYAARLKLFVETSLSECEKERADLHPNKTKTGARAASVREKYAREKFVRGRGQVGSTQHDDNRYHYQETAVARGATWPTTACVREQRIHFLRARSRSPFNF